MWVKALETVLNRMLLQGANFTSVLAISGSAQQHGSVFWNKQGIKTLEKLDPDMFLYNQLNESAFSVKRSPIWMDSSTSKQCEELEQAVGGREEMVKITGSKCYERFTAAQIRKIFQQQRDAYDSTVRISLVSSFLASILLNKIAPIDYSDGSGMNLLDINERRWSQKCLDACAEGVRAKLGEPVPTASVLGNIGSFFVQRYNFSPVTKIVAFTGDNSSAVAGLNIHDDWLAFSLGTSDTIMLCLNSHPCFTDGHVLIHPTKEDGFMGLLCFKNGALVRDTFKKAEANNSWEKFSEMLQNAPRGNNGFMALHYLSQEILPNVPAGCLRWTETDTLENSKARQQPIQFPLQQIEIRALIEGQMLNRKAFAMDMGFNFGKNTNILATGGSSMNPAILQVMSDVFNSPVYIQKTPEAACLGAAYRAKHVLYMQQAKESGDTYENYHDYIRKYCDSKHYYINRVAEPYADSELIYEPMLKRYREMVQVMVDPEFK
jgi:xylulokinase